MFRFNNDVGQAGSDSSSLPSTGRGRARSADFGLPGREGLLDLARTYLEVQARLWPDLAGTAAVPAPAPATLAAVKLDALADGAPASDEQADIAAEAALRSPLRSVKSDTQDEDLLRDGDEPPEPPTDGPARASGRPQLKRVK